MNLKQLSHHEVPFTQVTRPMILVCDAIKGPANAGALIRLSDAFGVQEIVFCGQPINLESNRLKKTARSTEKYVTVTQEKSCGRVLQKLKDRDFQLLGLEITSTSVALHDFVLSSKGTVLVLGNEQTGISNEVLALLDYTLHINMLGHNSSMNVSHAAAVALYELSKLKPHEI